MLDKYVSFTGWEVRNGRNCARGLECWPAQFLPIRTDLGRRITFLFFSYRDLKVSGNFTSAFNLCVEVARVRVDEARNRLQTKTKHYMIFS